MQADPRTTFVARLHLTRGVGPVLGRRLLEAFRTGEDMERAGIPGLREIQGVGPAKARTLAQAFVEAEGVLHDEQERARDHGVRLVPMGHPDYPALLAPMPDAPLALFCAGAMGPHDTRERDPYPVAMVGSRRATPYGIEQAERFSAHLASCGLTIVSGGARGIDAAAHRAALRAGGRTIAVLGCGLSKCYPPEHRGLYDQIVDQGGAVISELPMRTEPAAENFPARNRIVSGLSLGVLVIEAPTKSGALITARMAVETHGREVLAVPGRIDSPASAGCNELLRKNEAAIALEPKDVLDALESPARHAHTGTFNDRFPPPAQASDTPPAPRRHEPRAIVELTDDQRAIADALDEPLALESLSRAVELPVAKLQAELTVLELRKVIERRGASFVRV
ncbi:MAG: DNA-processing protein DprA [Planctomycetota bacterium]